MRKGFTLVEVLAVMIILGLLIVLTIPAYTSIFSGVKRKNLDSKLTEISAAAKKYGNTFKDKIKDAGNACMTTNIKTLIEKGYLVSDYDNDAAIINPTDNTKLSGDIKLCYCTESFDIEAFYTTEFDMNVVYHEGAVVVFGNKLYKPLKPFNRSELIRQDENNKEENKHNYKSYTPAQFISKFFEEVSC